MYELLAHVRRHLVEWTQTQTQGPVDRVMQTALQVSTSSTGSLRASAEIVEVQNRWSKIKGRTSAGRYAVTSTRTIAMEEENEETNGLSTLRGTSDGSIRSLSSNSNQSQAASHSSGSNTNAPPQMFTKSKKLLRQPSENSVVSFARDTRQWGVEMDLQLGQMTLRSRHLSALPTDVANNRDVLELFGESTIQASTLESGEHRRKYRLVGLSHELHYWHTPHMSCSPMSDQFEREYNPTELFNSETWIKGIWEPLRDAQYNGRPMQPPAMTFMMQEAPLRETAEVCVLLGLHQKLGGPYKLVYIFRRYKCVHVYECVSHGREWWYTLHLTTDNRYTLLDMQPSTKKEIKSDPPAWWLNGAGVSYPTDGPQPYLFNDITKEPNRSPTKSVVVVRDASHVDNLSGGIETFVPSRLLYGLIPSCLFELYDFYQDQTNQNDLRGNGRRKLRGYPKDDDATRTIIFVELGSIGTWDTGSKGNNGMANKLDPTQNVNSYNNITGLPGRAVRVHRRSKAGTFKIEK